MLFSLFEVSVYCPRNGKYLKHCGTDVNKTDVDKSGNKGEEQHLNSQSTGPNQKTYGEELHGVIPPDTRKNKVHNS